MNTEASDDAGLVRFHARLITPASSESAFQVVGRLTDYDVDTLALSARSFPTGSRLELTLAEGASDGLVQAVRRRLAPLDACGIDAVVRRATA